MYILVLKSHGDDWGSAMFPQGEGNASVACERLGGGEPHALHRSLARIWKIHGNMESEVQYMFNMFPIILC